MRIQKSGYQTRVCEWLAELSGKNEIDSKERTSRFLEESLELAQASGCSRADAVALLDYVYSRPTGKPELEAGGVMVTLAGLCSSLNIDMNQAGEIELNSNRERIEIIRQKRISRPAGSPLPQ